MVNARARGIRVTELSASTAFSLARTPVGSPELASVVTQYPPPVVGLPRFGGRLRAVATGTEVGDSLWKGMQ